MLIGGDTTQTHGKEPNTVTDESSRPTATFIWSRTESQRSKTEKGGSAHARQRMLVIIHWQGARGRSFTLPVSKCYPARGACLCVSGIKDGGRRKTPPGRRRANTGSGRRGPRPQWQSRMGSETHGPDFTRRRVQSN